MTTSVVRIDYLECLEKAIICCRREVACDLRCQNVEVRILVSKLLHRLQIQLQNNGAMWCGRWRCPARWSMKSRNTGRGGWRTSRRAGSSSRRNRVSSHGAMKAISIQVSAKGHNNTIKSLQGKIIDIETNGNSTVRS
jgi:hypothetical protein